VFHLKHPLLLPVELHVLLSHPLAPLAEVLVLLPPALPAEVSVLLPLVLPAEVCALLPLVLPAEVFALLPLVLPAEVLVLPAALHLQNQNHLVTHLPPLLILLVLPCIKGISS